MLPNESHGYAARESVMHTLWEQHQWLERHVKGAAPRDSTTEAPLLPVTVLTATASPSPAEPPHAATGRGLDDRTRAMAILALVFGVLSLFLFAFLFGPAAIVLGALAGRRGSPIGWWGLAAGVAGIVASLLLLASSGGGPGRAEELGRLWWKSREQIVSCPPVSLRDPGGESGA